jgi:hypothetical protein
MLKMPEAFHVMFTFPPSWVSGKPVPVSMCAMSGDVPATPVSRQTMIA